TVAPVRRTSSTSPAGGGPKIHTSDEPSATEIGPCRYSIAGYASAQARAASRLFSAASLAIPAAHPVPRKVNCRKPGAPAGSGAARAAAAAAGSPDTSSPRCARNSTSSVLGNRVCTTDRSSAKSSTTASRAAATTGESGSAVTTVLATPAGTAANAASTSVVLPVRVNASTRSYRRRLRNSDAGQASVSPCPTPSRNAAYAWAMQYEVPQPSTATRSPGTGSPAGPVAANVSAARQQAGWLAISSEAWLIRRPPCMLVRRCCAILV